MKDDINSLICIPEKILYAEAFSLNQINLV